MPITLICNSWLSSLEYDVHCSIVQFLTEKQRISVVFIDPNWFSLTRVNENRLTLNVWEYLLNFYLILLRQKRQQVLQGFPAFQNQGFQNPGFGQNPYGGSQSTSNANSNSFGFGPLGFGAANAQAQAQGWKMNNATFRSFECIFVL